MAGEDANLVVFDPRVEWTAHREDLHSRARNTPYDGRQLARARHHHDRQGPARRSRREIAMSRPRATLVLADGSDVRGVRRGFLARRRRHHG